MTSAHTFGKRSLAELRGTAIAALVLSGWSPACSDADDCLSPFFAENNPLAYHHDTSAVDARIKAHAAGTEKTECPKYSETIQGKVGTELSTVPLPQGAQIAVADKKVSGVTLDASFGFRFGTLAKERSQRNAHKGTLTK